MNLYSLSNNIESEIYKIASSLTKKNYKSYFDKLNNNINYASTASKLASEIFRQYQSQTEENFFFVYRLNDFFVRFSSVKISKAVNDILNQINIYIYVNYNKTDYDFKIWAEESDSGKYICGEL